MQQQHPPNNWTKDQRPLQQEPQNSRSNTSITTSGHNNSNQDVTWYPGDDFVLTQDWVIPHTYAEPAPSVNAYGEEQSSQLRAGPSQPPPTAAPTTFGDDHHHSYSQNLGLQGSPEEGESDDSSYKRFTTLNTPAPPLATATSSSSSIERDAPTADFRLQAEAQPPQSVQYPGPTGIPSAEYIAPSGTSLRRGMACRFCRRRKLRCTGERPTCSSCVKYKQECEYQPPMKAHKVQALESRVTELSDYISHGAPTVPPAFSSQPLAHEAPRLPQQMYPEPYQYPVDSRPQAQSYQDPNYPLPPGDDLNAVPAAFMANPAIPFGQDYTSYLPTPPQPVYPSTFPLEPNPQHRYPSFSEPGLLSGASSGSSPSAPPLGSSYPLDQGQQYSSDTSVMYPQMSSDDSAPVNYTFPATSQTNTATPYIPSQAGVNPLSTPVPGIRQRIARSESSTHIVNTPGGSASTGTPGSQHAPPASTAVYTEGASLRYTTDVEDTDPVEGLTVRLGEFLFSPTEDASTTTNVGQQGQDPDEWSKKRRTNRGQSGQWTSGGKATGNASSRTALFQSKMESDGLRDEHRNLLLDCFLAHCRLFFEMSIPRFRYRMTFNDRRRPSLALLNAMYLWATRMTNSPGLSAMEAHFFSEACRHLDSAGPNSDRLIDAVRAAMLLCAYSYTNGRHHEGWLIAGLAVRLVLSTGVHQIPSLTLRPPPPESPFLRNRVHLLPPPEDAIELAERVHAFWCVYAVERCGALATGFPSSLKDEDITTPFGRPIDDIASQSVTLQDDVTIRDLYRGQAYARPAGDTPYIRWVKAVTILERASKLAFLTPADDSEYTIRWTEYATTLGQSPERRPSPPPGSLNQPKYRNPVDYEECLRALKYYVETLGEDGIWPVERRRVAEREGVTLPQIKSHTILLHHQIVAVEMLAHDINSLDIENDTAVSAGRRSADLLRQLPPIPFNEIDAQVILVWCMITKVLIKEMRRCVQLGNFAATRVIEDDVNVLIQEMARIGSSMHLARVQWKAMEELKKAALAV